MSPLNNTLVAEAGASSRGVPAAGAPAVGLQHTNTIRAPAATLEPLWVRRLLMLAAFLFLGLFLFVPLFAVFAEAFRKGWDAYIAAIVEPDALAAIRLTLLTAAIAVPLNLVFGVSAAWCIAKFDFRGKNLLITLIDLPFSVSPVISGLIYVLIFGAPGWLGDRSEEHTSELQSLMRISSAAFCLKKKI